METPEKKWTRSELMNLAAGGEAAPDGMTRESALPRPAPPLSPCVRGVDLNRIGAKPWEELDAPAKKALWVGVKGSF